MKLFENQSVTESQEKATDECLPTEGSVDTSRRKLFNSFGLGAVALVVSACSKTEFNGNSKKKTPTTDEQDNTSQTEDPSATSDPVEQEAEVPIDAPDPLDCSAVMTVDVDLSKVAGAPADLIPAMRFYGKPESTLFAYKFTTSHKVELVTVLNTKGKLIALHSPTDADVKAGAYRPMIIDNLNLVGLSHIKLLIKADGAYYQTTYAIGYFNSLNNLPVVDLSSAPVLGTTGANETIPRFGEKSGFNQDANVVYPTDPVGGARNLFTAQNGSLWNIATTDIRGLVTDIMGDNLVVNENFILENQTYCTYVDGGDGKLYRTMIKVG